ncbi:MAG TPA: D-alanyl-D-alanine carboxypeptidase/D-alanyl-D-alanine-endopeptidase [Myxococcota bacterium]|nr:D-alanyl-D-alanine carboxypeptidase/D-alanyl-D-alanine-endopeptidase [Myxococcota bacterium]
MHRALRFSSRIAALAVLGVGLVALPPLADVAADDLDSELEVAPATEAAVVAPIPTLDPVLSPLTEDRLFRDSTVALQVVDIATGQEVYAYNADQALNPASTMKVITAATALRTLGPEYRFETTVDHDGTLGADGILAGSLYVKGTGDPTFVIEDLWKLVYDLRLEGVREVKGNVYFDDSFMTAESGVPGWNKKADIERGPSYYPSLGALSLNFNTISVVAGPGPDVGGAARVEVETPSPGVVEVDNQLITSASGTRRRILLERDVTGDKVTLSLAGTIPQDSTAQHYYRSVPDAKAYFTAAFAGMMKDQGIRVRGKYLDGEVPERSKSLLRHRSDDLSTILARTNKHSNNFMAEQVLKAVGAEVGGEGSTEAGLSVVMTYLEELGIPSEEYTLVNGSGLSRQLLVRPTHLNAVLVDMARDEQVGPEFTSSLAIGGRDGTLWARFRDEDQVGKLRGKTGTLNGVHCLAGYVEGGDGERYAFAFLVNDLPYSIARARQAHDRFADLMFELGDTQVVAKSE